MQVNLICHIPYVDTAPQTIPILPQNERKLIGLLCPITSIYIRSSEVICALQQTTRCN